MASAAAIASTSPSPSSGMAPPPPPPPTARRPRRRAREISSRYLSTPLPPSPRNSTASSSPTPSPRAHHHPYTPFANENHPPPHPHPHPHPHPPATASRKRAVQKLFDENTNPTAPAHRPRPPTPAVSRLPRSVSATVRKGYPRPPTPARAGSCPGSDAEDASTCSETSSTVTDFSDADTAPAVCESPPLLGPASCRGRPSSELRSSMPEAGGRASNPLCYRSLNSALSSCQAAGKVVVARPPQPPGMKVAEVKKVGIAGKKAAGRQEDVHQLRLLDNCYVQYRFLNARAEVVRKAKNAAAEKSLYGLSERIAGLWESVAEKRAELERIKRMERLSSIVDAQVPYLEYWSDLEVEHSSCLTGAATALHDASLRIPIVGNVRANIQEITEVLNSAMQMLEPLSPCVEDFLPKVEEIDNVASNLAKVVVGERALIEDCGNLLYQAHNMQMREYSLRSQLMQLKQIKAS